MKQQAVQLSLWPAVDPREEYIREYKRLLRYANYGRSLRQYWENTNPCSKLADGTFQRIPFEELYPLGDVKLP